MQNSRTAGTGPAVQLLFHVNYLIVGACPNCGSQVVEIEKPFHWKCQNPRCHFSLWPNNPYFHKLGKELDRETVTALAQKRQVYLTGMLSAKTGRTYDATIHLDTDEAGSPRFSMTFPKKKER